MLMFFINSALKFKHHLVFLKVFSPTLCTPMWEGEREIIKIPDLAGHFTDLGECFYLPESYV